MAQRERTADASARRLNALVGLMDDLAERVARRVVELQQQIGPAQSVPELMTLDEAAKRLRVSDSTIRRWKRSGTIPTERVGGRIRVRTADVFAMLARPEAAATTPDPPAVESGADPEVERAWERLTRKVS